MIPLDGNQIAEDILNRLRALPVPKKFLAGVLIGNDPASESFQKIKQRNAEKLGVDYRIYHLDPALGQDKLRKEVGKIAAHKTCGGVIVQLPLPEGLDRHYILNAVPREKDPDVLSERSLGAFYTGRNRTASRLSRAPQRDNPAHAGFYEILPPSVGVVSEILSTIHYPLSTSSLAIVGPGFLIGRPIATWLMGKTKQLFILGKHSDFSVLKHVDLVITGVGLPGLITPEMLKDGASVIDFGYGTGPEGKPSGDFLPPPLLPTPYSLLTEPNPSSTPYSLLATPFYTPTPHGTGPILVAKLMENFYLLNQDKTSD